MDGWLVKSPAPFDWRTLAADLLDDGVAVSVSVVPSGDGTRCFVVGAVAGVGGSG